MRTRVFCERERRRKDPQPLKSIGIGPHCAIEISRCDGEDMTWRKTGDLKCAILTGADGCDPPGERHFPRRRVHGKHNDVTPTCDAAIPVLDDALEQGPLSGQVHIKRDASRCWRDLKPVGDIDTKRQNAFQGKFRCSLRRSTITPAATGMLNLPPGGGRPPKNVDMMLPAAVARGTVGFC